MKKSVNYFIINFISAFILFFVITPGIVVNIPAKGDKYVKAIVHALVFALIFVIVHMIVSNLSNYVEGLEEKDEIVKELKQKIDEIKNEVLSDAEIVYKEIKILSKDPSLITETGLDPDAVKYLLSLPYAEAIEQIKDVLPNVTSQDIEQVIKKYINVFTDPKHKKTETEMAKAANVI